jgi:hypothetical protein
VPGYLTEVHHVTDYAKCRTTDVNDLTQGCGPHHKLVTCGAWRTRKLKTGDTEWIPPPHSPASGGTPTAANPAPIPTTTPKNCCATMTTATHRKSQASELLPERFRQA